MQGQRRSSRDAKNGTHGAHVAYKAAGPSEIPARALGATWTWTTSRRGLSQKCPDCPKLRLRRCPEPAQVRKRVDAGRVSAVECDLHRVLPDESHVLDAQLIMAQLLK